MAARCVRWKKSRTAFGTRLGFTDCVPKQVEQAPRSGVIEIARMSGRPHFSAVAAPPESNADVDPTAAKASSQPFAYACWSPPESLRVSSASSLSLRPQMSEVALK